MLDYRPNPVARALATGKSKTLGVVSFNTTLYGPASTLFGLERAAHRSGLLRQHRQPPVPRPQLGAGCGRAAAGPGRRGDPRHRTPDRRRARGVATAQRHPLGRGRGRPGRGCARRDGRPVRRRRAGDPAPSGSRASNRLAHRRPGRLARGTTAHRRLAVDARVGWRAGAAGARRRLGLQVGVRARPATRCAIPRSRRSSRATTRWRWGFSGPSTRRVGRLRAP